MGNMAFPEPKISAEEMHAIDVIIDLVMNNPNEIEIVAIGPLTNIALAYLKEPRVAKNIKNLVVMGSGGFGPGNITPAAEFNFYSDAEAASIILNSGMKPTLVGFDIAMGKAFINQNDIDYLSSNNSEISEFCLRCNKIYQKFYFDCYGRIGFSSPDATAMAVAISSDIIKEKVDAYTHVETKSEFSYGESIIDFNNILKKKSNAIICKEIYENKFKEMLFRALV